MLSQLPQINHPDLISQEIPFADAAIYRLNDSEALVQSVDFFTPVVDDPYIYGQIAAANALSDLFAIGSRPLTALNLVSFPVGCLDADILVKILQGGAERVHAAGAVVAGGHSIEDDEPKYGLCVTGIVDPQKMVTTCGCQVGDQLYLTKPLGTGLLTTALRGEILTETDIAVAIAGMVSLNKEAAEVMLKVGVSACTDITGFGLIGHASEMAEASGVRLKIFVNDLPAYPQALDMAEMGLVPAGSHRNRDFYSPCLDGRDGCDPLSLDLLSDAQTSGGLLIAVAKGKVDLFEQELTAAGLPVYRVGEVVSGASGRLLLEDR
ncbi:selenophosphate synthase [Desulfuromusa kysingii]|uniref:Selenide, water dikinase n=1 Tax=Desulfuromusa kysingii TaxID=37625 RepID=A0A1H4C5T8_9BACT|nr:selenophosphate synthase [Desulfuromusa kysingii]